MAQFILFAPLLGALIAGKPMVLGITINRIFGDVLDQ